MNRLCALCVLLWLTYSVIAAPKEAYIDTPFFRFTVSGDNGACEILDKEAQVTWRADTTPARFGWVRLNVHEQSVRVELTRCAVQANGNELVASFQPFRVRPLTRFTVKARALPDQRTLELSYQEDNELEVESVSLLDEVLDVTDETKGCVAVPVREGLLVPADSGRTFRHRFDTSAYEGCHMEMLGVVKQGAAALFTWDDPYVSAELGSTLEPTGTSSKRQRLSPSLVLTKSARTFRIQFLGKGDYVTIGQAYRKIAEEKGLLVTWEQKLKGHPERTKLFGAANIKLWSALDRRMNPESTKEESVRVNWTFDEAAQVAEHLKNDLKLDKVLFTIGGWIHRGYDNQHPDILPTAPECGGDAAFADCARRVLNLGYLLCLHDNYQDIYRDSPSWDEKLIMKTEDGKLAKGGRWAGGQAYLTCSQKAGELAKRPQNLPAVKKLSGADAYFIDTTYAAGLQECYEPAHPLTRADDMKWKQALSDYGREVFGIFGSECGREWAIPHSDFFEGLTGVSGHDYHDASLPEKLGATVVPLFDFVYRDCIAMYGKYGYDPAHAAEYVLHHISLGRPLNYHSVPAHLYWRKEKAHFEPLNRPPEPGMDPAVFTRADDGWAEGLHPVDRFIKNTCEVLSPLNELTARLQMSDHQFLTPDRRVQRTVFGEGPSAVEVVVNAGGTNFLWPSKLGGKVLLPPYGFLVESPTFVAFHAREWNGLNYDAPPMFTLRSLDNEPLSCSHRLRVFHGFGDGRIHLGKTTRTVPKEAIVDATAQ
ncbi:MAG TPA: DUF5696 domain-containing protein [Candidatus Acidoferrum sp.]|jgi:hypothetical protein|nr:DUF5696 domain-containing protein [Candidatus Acidoferrum sp.]